MMDRKGHPGSHDKPVSALHGAETWTTIRADAAYYVDSGVNVILCDRLPKPVTLVLKNADVLDPAEGPMKRDWYGGQRAFSDMTEGELRAIWQKPVDPYEWMNGVNQMNRNGALGELNRRAALQAQGEKTREVSP